MTWHLLRVIHFFIIFMVVQIVHSEGWWWGVISDVRLYHTKGSRANWRSCGRGRHFYLFVRHTLKARGESWEKSNIYKLVKLRKKMDDPLPKLKVYKDTACPFFVKCGYSTRRKSRSILTIFALPRRDHIPLVNIQLNPNISSTECMLKRPSSQVRTSSHKNSRKIGTLVRFLKAHC